MKFAICIATALAIFAVPVVSGIAQPASGTSGSYKIEKTLLGPWDRGLDTQPFFVSAPDPTPGCGAACGLVGLGFALLWDAAAASSRPVYLLSNDRLHFAYVSNKKHVCGEALRICVVIDGQIEAVPDVNTMGYLSFAKDDKHFSYKAKAKGGQWSVITLALQGDRWTPAGEELTESQDQPPPKPDSPESKSDPKSEPKSDPAPDQNPGPNPGPKPDSDSNPGSTPPAQDVPSSGALHSPDGKRTVSVEFKRGRFPYTVVVDGQTSAKYLAIGRGTLRFSPDSKHLVFTASKIGGWIVVLDGRESKEYGKVSAPVFSSDSGHVAYAARTKRFAKPWTVFIDERECGNFDDVGFPFFSPDGKHVGFIATTALNRNKWFLVMDNETGEEFDGLPGGSPSFGADGTLEYLAHAGDSLYRIKYVPKS